MGSSRNASLNVNDAEHLAAPNPHALLATLVDNGALAHLPRIAALTSFSNTNGVFQRAGVTC